MCDELSMLHSLLFLIHTKSMSFYREVLFSTPSLFYISTYLPPRQVVRRSLLFFSVSLPSCEKSFYCRVSPNCVGRDECGDPNRNDLTTYLSEIKQQIVLGCCIETRHGVSWKMFGQLFVVFYCGPGHLTPLRHRKGSCDQCRTVHEGFKPLSPCFLYGVNKN